MSGKNLSEQMVEDVERLLGELGAIGVELEGLIPHLVAERLDRVMEELADLGEKLRLKGLTDGG